MVLEVLSPAKWKVLSPGSKNAQEDLAKELDIMSKQFPDAKSRDLRRFLMGYGMKSSKAIPAYEAHLKWREESLPVTKESCINELRKGRFYFHGHDKQGRPIAYYSLANHDPKNRDLAEIFRMMTYQIEKALEHMSNDVTGFTIVWDTRNTGLRNTDNEFLKEFLNFFRAHYPEVLAQMIIAPVGLLQRSVWNMACRFLDERRASRIKMVAGIEGLLEYVDEQELLSSHGGKTNWAFDRDLV